MEGWVIYREVIKSRDILWLIGFGGMLRRWPRGRGPDPDKNKQVIVEIMEHAG